MKKRYTIGYIQYKAKKGRLQHSLQLKGRLQHKLSCLRSDLIFQMSAMIAAIAEESTATYVIVCQFITYMFPLLDGTIYNY